MLYSDLSISNTTYDFVNDFVYRSILGQELALLLVKIYPLKKILSLHWNSYQPIANQDGSAFPVAYWSGFIL